MSFDAGKKHVKILHPRYADGDSFKLLGCLTDCKLIMDQAIDKTLSQFRPRITALLRTRGHYNVKDLIGQFKTQIWGIMEANNGGIFHAATRI